MRSAIFLYGFIALALLAGIDRTWPFWPVHVVAGLLGVVVALLTGLAVVASGRR